MIEFVKSQLVTKILIFFSRCEGQKECVVPVNSELFHDACPGTHKYLEIHYACLSANSDNKMGPRGPPKLPGWFKPKNSQNIPNIATPATSHEQNSVNSAVNSNKTETESAGPRKPILVTKKGRDKVPITTERVPITTESTTTPSTKSRTDSTTTTPRTTSSPTPAPIHFPGKKKFKVTILKNFEKYYILVKNAKDRFWPNFERYCDVFQVSA